VTVTIAGTTDDLREVSASPRGGEMLGVTAPGGGSYAIHGHDVGCHEDSDGVDFVSNMSSLADGQAMLWWWNVVSEGFATLTDGEDVEPGELTVEVDEGSPTDQLLAFVEDIGGVGAPLEQADTYLVRFDPGIGVFPMLAEISRYDRFVDAAPTWRESAPAWW
jgi:hypothetical protein